MNTEPGKKPVDQALEGQDLPEKGEVSEEALESVTGGLNIYDPTGCYAPLRFGKLLPQTQAQETKK